MERQKQIQDLCGNEYLLKEAEDIKGKFLEVYEIVQVEGQKMITYLCDIDGVLEDDTNTLLDEIDERKHLPLYD